MIILYILPTGMGVRIMHKFWEWIKKIPDAYYSWKKRNEKLTEFLDNCHKSSEKLSRIEDMVTQVQTDMEAVKAKVNDLEQQIDQVNGRLETIGAGTKMELFDTLHNWRIILVVHKGWASTAEKREVEEIYRIYHDKLNGNGQGERYYNEIMELPESEEEKLNQRS